VIHPNSRYKEHHSEGPQSVLQIMINFNLQKVRGAYILLV